MKNTLLSLALLLLIPVHSTAQTTDHNQHFQSFWRKFKIAVAKNDKQAVASMTKLPFLFESKERTRTQFIRIYNQLFDMRVRKCFATAKALKEGDVYEVFCAKKIFYFGKVEGEYKMIEFGVDY
ncbi:MAG TPA: hypothetical protein VF131_14225 [Blastocatellia bacterium]|nr:hypothetical protein [Blastocatellia bacterium]